MSRSQAKGKQRAPDSDASNDAQQLTAQPSRNQGSTSSRHNNPSKSDSRVSLQDEEAQLSLAEHINNEAGWTPEEKARRERKTRADYRKLQLEIEGR